jgi:hypothetical protein
MSHAIIGFEIQPSQSQLDVTELDRDLVSLLFSLTYNPDNISKVTLDLRYVACQAKSLVAKALDIILLIRVDFGKALSKADSATVLERFRGSFFDLLSLHLTQYEFSISPLGPERVRTLLSPFEIKHVVEISRRVLGTRPFSLAGFKGGSPMTRVVDMLLREEGQTFLSVSLEPHLPTKEQVHALEVFGYKNPVLPSRKNEEEELLDSVLGLQKIAESNQTVFRMRIRLCSDKDISQYLVNLVGSEISGQRDFYYFRPQDLDRELQSIKELTFLYSAKDVMDLDIPDVLFDLFYLFRPDEAIAAFRLPTQRISVAQEKMYKTYPAPVRFLPNDGMRLGTATHPSYKGELPVYISAEDRARHIYIIGKTGTGKSFHILNMIRQDLASNGVCLIDPHGDLVNSLFPYIPETRIDDVYYFDPSDPEYVMGLNFLETTATDKAERENEQDHIVQEVLEMLLRLVDYDLSMFGPIAQQWTRYACLTLMDTQAGTLVDIPRLAANDEFRESVVERVTNPIVRQWWETEYKNYSLSTKNEILGYFTSKFTSMVTPPQVRNIVGQYRSTLDFRELMNAGKILLVNLSSGLIGRINSQFLGSLLVSRLLWNALNRAKEPTASRRQFFLYIDEFQNFVSESIDQILSEARKYGLSLTIAHQHLDQLRSFGRMSNRIERSIFGNIGTMISFRVGGDAAFLAGEFGEPADPVTLRNLANRYAVLTMQVGGVPSTPFTMHTLDWVPPTDAMLAVGERIRDRARKKGRLLKEVSAEISARFGRSLESDEPQLATVR